MNKNTDATEATVAETLQVVSGSPNSEELATVIAVLQAALAEAEQSKTTAKASAKTSWSKGGAQLRNTITPGPGQWRASSRHGLN